MYILLLRDAAIKPSFRGQKHGLFLSSPFHVDNIRALGHLLSTGFGFIIEVLTEYLPAGTAVKYSSAVDREWHGAHAFVFAFFGKEWPE